MAGCRFDPDGDVNMEAGPTVPQPNFEVVRPPKLVSWNHASLVSWYRDWKHYVTKIRRRCAVTGEVFERVVATVKGAKQPNYILQRPLEAITESEVLQLIYTRSQTLVNEFVPDVKWLVSQSLHMDLSTDDCDARSFGLIGKTDSSMQGYRNRLKARWRLLIDNLQPVVLKEQIERLVELERRDSKTDDCTRKRNSVSTVCPRKLLALVDLKRLSSAGSAGATEHKQGGKATKTTKHQDAEPNVGRRKAPLKPAKQAFLPMAGGSHPMRECPMATAEQREEDLARYRVAKEQKGSVARDSAKTVKINNLLEIVFIPDTVAEMSVIPSCVVHSLMALQPDLPVQRVETPVQVVVADGRRLECDRKVTVDLHLNTGAGLVHVPQVTCVVMDREEKELLLGKDILSDLGINVDDMLAQLAHGADFVDESDDFDVGDDSQETQTSEVIQAGIDSLVEQAAANGMDVTSVEELRQAVNQFPDIWQEALNMPPAHCVFSYEKELPPAVQAAQKQVIRDHVEQLAKNDLRIELLVGPALLFRFENQTQGTSSDLQSTTALLTKSRCYYPKYCCHDGQGEWVGGTDQFDLKNGFWQLPLAEESQEVLSFMTDEGVYTPTRVSQGAMDSALHFQSQMQRVLAELIPHNAQVWIDVLIYAKTGGEFIDVIRRFYLLLHRHN
ncbi:LOW QUALITY PROTEIN: hypothetical protein PHMEG_00019703 [Phytophthora megakarya]|uniref:Reverse transcriptase n=1 Tax=Phytophthora megakarya TaxID=4795 RepID=A0A225VS55_9STRA|nr:LOW QUALITY PROTEIN: hypothetical protein PHMEG_00019703 [Phytophthora megakarya]